MSQKKRKSSVRSISYLNSINAITRIISHALVVLMISAVLAADADNRTNIAETTATESHGNIPHFETGFAPMLPTQPHLDKHTNANSFLSDATFKINTTQDNESITRLHKENGTASQSFSLNVEQRARSREDEKLWRPTRPQPVHTFNTKDLQQIILQYVDETLSKRTYEIINGLKIEIGNKTNNGGIAIAGAGEERRRSSNDNVPFEEKLYDRLRRFAETHVINLNIPRALQSTGRIFFFKGLKKLMWPIFIGMQVAKTVLLAMFLPSIIGSLGKIVGKGLSSVSGFGHPVETVDNLEFKDNYNPNQEQDMTGGYSYPQGDSAPSNNQFAAQMYDSATANNALSRFGIGGATYVNSPAVHYSRNTNFGNAGGSMMMKHDFKDFHDIPASSLLLTNYDPFYSPLLSRLDAVFQQMGLGPGNEKCREKLVCLMYASPAKYAPYSNLVSAQLSRELNELKKPTSDNPDILRFFKYMRAAKDGQDRANCDINFRECTSLKDSESPAMITTYNDINKLVQARKL